LLNQQAAIPPSAQAEFADQLLITGALPGRTLDAMEELTVGHGMEKRGWSFAISVDGNGSGTPAP
jgi:hypothetical protein